MDLKSFEIVFPGWDFGGYRHMKQCIWVAYSKEPPFLPVAIADTRSKRKPRRR